MINSNVVYFILHILLHILLQYFIMLLRRAKMRIR